MDDLAERLRQVEVNPSPDVWDDIVNRAEHPASKVPGSGIGSRLAAAVVALAVFAGAGALVLRAFDSEGRVGESPSPSITGTVERLKAVVTDRIEVAPFPNAVVVGLGSVWVAAPREDGSGGGEILRFDPETAQIEARIPVDHVPGWDWGSAGMAVGLGDVWVADSLRPDFGLCCAAVVQRIDAETNTVESTFGAGTGYGSDVWVDADGVWVLRNNGDRADMSVVRLDPSSGEIISEVDVPVWWSQTIFGADGKIVVLGHRGEDGTDNNTLVELDPSSGAVVNVTSLGEEACPPAVAVQSSGYDCVGSELGDGEGGFWILQTRGAPHVYQHINAEGELDRVVDAGGDADLAGGQHMAYDATTDTFWFVQYKDMMVRVALEPIEQPGGVSEVPSPPAPADGPFSLWLSAERVPEGPAELVAILVNHEGVDATFGVYAKVDRWNGTEWIPYGDLVMCMDHWHCTARVELPGGSGGVPDIGLSAQPGIPGPVERFTTDGLEPGWYRISQEANEGVTAVGILEVAADAPDPTPMVSVDAPAISVTPALLPTSGGEVGLYPLIPSPSGSQSREDIERAIRGLSDIAFIERWTRANWEPEDKVDVGVATDDLARSTIIPTLSEGAYRIVREGDEIDHVGHFWVDDAI